MSMTTVGTTRERLQGRWLGLAALTVSGLVLGLDITILVTALPTLSAKLNATTDQLQWMSAAYTLALAGFMLPAGVLGDRLGRKRMLLIGLATFGISSVIASQMTSANGLILMRVVMGFSGAIVLPLMQSMLPSMFDEDERQRAIGIAGAGAFIGLPLGPLLAGWLLTHYDWGSIFLINAPVVVIGVIGVWFFVPESKEARLDRRHPRGARGDGHRLRHHRAASARLDGCAGVRPDRCGRCSDCRFRRVAAARAVPAYRPEVVQERAILVGDGRFHDRWLRDDRGAFHPVALPPDRPGQ